MIIKVCSNCGCPPPRTGEIGEWCSACGAGVVYSLAATVDSPTPAVYLFNTSILTTYGEFKYEPLALRDVKYITGAFGFVSAIGHQATAEILTELLDLPVSVNRVNHTQTASIAVIVFKLRGRPEEGKILSRAEVDTIGYDFGLLTRTS